MSGAAMVSCIMPTRGRGELAALAVRCWQEQSWPAFARELIIVDDGPAPCDALATAAGNDRRIRTMRLPGRPSIGFKLNLGTAAARGDLIAAWADDDWHGPERLERQVAAMEDPAVEVCGCDSIAYWSPGWGELWRYEHVPGRRGNGYVTGGTMMWRRRFWGQQRFDEEPRPGEDTRFIQGRHGLRGDLANDWYLATIHGNNTSVKRRETLEASGQWTRLTGEAQAWAADWWVRGMEAALGARGGGG